MLRVLKAFFLEYSIDVSKLLSITADGASVNGVRRVQTNTVGKNLAAHLRTFTGHRLLAIHCAAHRLQLCAGDAWTHVYLKELEKRVHSLYKFLKKHPSTKIDLLFWQEVTEEPLLTSLSVGKSRWLSLLKPLQKLLRSWVSVLSHLHYHWTHHADRESQKTIRWIFVFLCSWKAKLVMSAICDILELAFATKNKLEQELTLDEVGDAIQTLSQKLRGFCEKASVAAEALAGNRAVAVGQTWVEKACAEYRQERDKELCLKYTLVDGSPKEYWIAVEDLGGPDEIKDTFKIFKAWKHGQAPA